MRLLLDTHALLWALLEPGHLSASARAAVTDPGNTLLVSAASAWEIATKHRLGKLDGAGAVIAGYPAHVERLRAIELPVTARHALAGGGLDWGHRDPFDRLLAAQSLLESARLVTGDRAFASLPDLSVLW